MALTSSVAFQVRITLESHSICTNTTLSERANAIVRVVCGTNHFVNIEPRPGSPFFGTHGGAFRFSFAPGSPPPSISGGQSNPYIGAGTVTALHIYNATGSDEPLEFLVSF